MEKYFRIEKKTMEIRYFSFYFYHYVESSTPGHLYVAAFFINVSQ